MLPQEVDKRIGGTQINDERNRKKFVKPDIRYLDDIPSKVISWHPALFESQVCHSFKTRFGYRVRLSLLLATLHGRERAVAAGGLGVLTAHTDAPVVAETSNMQAQAGWGIMIVIVIRIVITILLVIMTMRVTRNRNVLRATQLITIMMASPGWVGNTYYHNGKSKRQEHGKQKRSCYSMWGLGLS